MPTLFDGDPIGRLTVSTNNNIGTLNAASGVKVNHKQIGTLIETTLTLTDMPQSIINGTEYQGTKLWTMPKGHIRIEAADATLTEKTTSDLATTLNASSSGRFGVGTATASATTLATTMQNIIPQTTFTSSATVNVAGTAVTAELGTGAFSDAFLLDGSTTPIAVYFNSSIPTTTDVDGDATVTWSGTIIITWSYLASITSII